MPNLQNHFSKDSFLTLIIVIFSLYFLNSIYSPNANPENNTIVAEKFVLQNSAGKTGAQLTFLDENSPALIMFDNNGSPRFSITINEDNYLGVSFIDGEGMSGVGIGVDAAGYPNLGVLDKSGSKRINISINEEDQSSLTFYQPDSNNSKKQFEITADNNGYTTLNFIDQNENLRTALRMNELGVPALLFLDDYNLRIALGLLKNDASSLVMTNNDGEIIFQVPEN